MDTESSDSDNNSTSSGSFIDEYTDPEYIPSPAKRRRKRHPPLSIGASGKFVSPPSAGNIHPVRKRRQPRQDPRRDQPGTSTAPDSGNDSDFEGFDADEVESLELMATRLADLMDDNSDDEDANELLCDETPFGDVDYSQPPELHKFDYRKSGFKVLIPDDADDVWFFDRFFDDEFFTLLSEYTNAYAQHQIDLGATGGRKSEWKATTPDEMKQWIGMLIHMGSVKMPSISHYFRKRDPLYQNRLFQGYPLFGISGRRFRSIMSFLHLSDDYTIGGDDRLAKIRPILHHFQKVMDDLYYPGRELSLDEAMVPWKGRFIFRQYIPNKAHKYGLKIYELCEPDGICVRLIVYVADQGGVILHPGKSHTESIVLSLMEDCLNRGHRLFMDNYYNSVKLTRDLYNLKTHVTGTLRKTRVGNPKKVVDAKLQKGQQVAQQSGPVIVTKWKDKREVLMISSEFPVDMIEDESKIPKPICVVEYNEFMGGVDHMDQMISYYGDSRKSRRWYIKLFLHVLEIYLINAYYLHIKFQSARKQSFLQFRDRIVRRLLFGGASKGPPEKARNPKDIISDVISHHREADEAHLWVKIAATSDQRGKDEGRTKRRRCVQCKKAGIRKDTNMECRSCEAALCSAGCHRAFHDRSK